MRSDGLLRLYRRIRRLSFLVLVLAAPALTLTWSGCTTRESPPVMAPDSTMVYTAKQSGDVNATITFSLKDSKKRAEQLRQERERQRELARQKREEERRAAEELRQRQAEEARKAREAEKAKKHGKHAKKGKRAKDSGESGAAQEQSPPKLKKSHRISSSQEDSSKPNDSRQAPAGIAGDKAESSARPDSTGVAVGSPAGAEGIAAGTAAESAGLTRKSKKNQPPVDEHVFDMEEGAKVLATIKLENPRGRGDRPLLFHFLWINQEGKAAFRKILEYVPNDSVTTLTSTFGISPLKRQPGRYSFRVYLFREIIAEKSFLLQGESLMPKEQDEGKELE
jgi:hypothetical protein